MPWFGTRDWFVTRMVCMFFAMLTREIARGGSPLYVESEENYIAVLDNVFLAFRTHEALVLCRSNRTAFNKIVKGNDFCSDKASFKVGVNLTCRLRSLCSLGDSPCTNFLRTCRLRASRSYQLPYCRSSGSSCMDYHQGNKGSSGGR